MNRYDALAPALFDVFTTHPDETPFAALPRTVPDLTNPPNTASARYSALMDFRGPDRNPELGDILSWERTGSPPAGSRIAMEVARGLPPSLAPADDDDDAREAAVSEAGWSALYAYLSAHPEAHADLRPLPAGPKRPTRPVDPD